MVIIKLIVILATVETPLTVNCCHAGSGSITENNSNYYIHIITSIVVTKRATIITRDVIVVQYSLCMMLQSVIIGQTAQKWKRPSLYGVEELVHY